MYPVVLDKVLARPAPPLATDITREDRTIDIRIRSEERFRDSSLDLGNFSILQTGTTPILLSSVAEIIERVVVQSALLCHPMRAL